jgi:hypothetical protein
MDNNNDRRTQDEQPDGLGRSEFARDPLSEELLSAYLDGECSAAEQAQLEERIAGSPEFRQFVDELRSVRSSLELLPQYRLRPDFAEHVLRRAEREVLTASGPESHTSVGTVARAVHDVTTQPVGDVSRRTPEPGRSARPFLWTLAALAAAVLLLVTNREPEIRRDEFAKGPAPPAATQAKKSAQDQSGQADAPKALAQELTNLSDTPDSRSSVGDDAAAIKSAVGQPDSGENESGEKESIVERAKEKTASTLTIDAKNKSDGVTEKLADSISAGGAAAQGPGSDTAETQVYGIPLAASASAARDALPRAGDDLHVIEVVVTRDAWQRGAVQGTLENNRITTFDADDGAGVEAVDENGRRALLSPPGDVNSQTQRNEIDAVRPNQNFYVEKKSSDRGDAKVAEGDKARLDRGAAHDEADGRAETPPPAPQAPGVAGVRSNGLAAKFRDGTEGFAEKQDETLTRDGLELLVVNATAAQMAATLDDFVQQPEQFQVLQVTDATVAAKDVVEQFGRSFRGRGYSESPLNARFNVPEPLEGATDEAKQNSAAYFGTRAKIVNGSEKAQFNETGKLFRETESAADTKPGEAPLEPSAQELKQELPPTDPNNDAVKLRGQASGPAKPSTKAGRPATRRARTEPARSATEQNTPALENSPDVRKESAAPIAESPPPAKTDQDNDASGASAAGATFRGGYGGAGGGGFGARAGGGGLGGRAGGAGYGGGAAEFPMGWAKRVPIQSMPRAAAPAYGGAGQQNPFGIIDSRNSGIDTAPRSDAPQSRNRGVSREAKDASAASQPADGSVKMYRDQSRAPANDIDTLKENAAPAASPAQRQFVLLFRIVDEPLATVRSQAGGVQAQKAAGAPASKPADQTDVETTPVPAPAERR